HRPVAPARLGVGQRLCCGGPARTPGQPAGASGPHRFPPRHMPLLGASALLRGRRRGRHRPPTPTTVLLLHAQAGFDLEASADRIVRHVALVSRPRIPTRSEPLTMLTKISQDFQRNQRASATAENARNADEMGPSCILTRHEAAKLM